VGKTGQAGGVFFWAQTNPNPLPEIMKNITPEAKNNLKNPFLKGEGRRQFATVKTPPKGGADRRKLSSPREKIRHNKTTKMANFPIIGRGEGRQDTHAPKQLSMERKGSER